jgi:hypothetical protein
MHRRRPGALAALAIAGVLSVRAAPASARDWGGLGLDGTRARITDEISGGRFDGGAWRHDWKPLVGGLEAALLASPAIADGYLAFATQQNLVRVLDERDGRLLWQARAGGTAFASPALWRGHVYIFGLNQRLTALRVTDGGVAWERDLGGMGYASPVVDDGALFVVSTLPTVRLWCLDAASGAVRWQAGEGAFDTSVQSSVAIAGGQLLVTQLEGRIFSFARGDGKLMWSAATGGQVSLSSPLVVGDRVHLLTGGARARLHALDLASGAAVVGWPIDLSVPAAGGSFGSPRERKYVVSSAAGGDGAIALSVRADDSFGANASGEPDSFVTQEHLFLVDPAGPTILWSRPHGRLETRRSDDIPNFDFLPTPLLYRSASGERLIAAASSLEADVKVFASNADERWRGGLSAATRSSPVLANGRLVVGTDAGVIHSFLSGSNRPPFWPAPIELGSATVSPATGLRWAPATDPESEPIVYQVRIDDDGEILRDWDFEIDSPAGQTAIALPSLAGPAVFAVRARDPEGALSAWTAPQTIEPVTAGGVITVDDQPVADLPAAIAAAHAGSQIRLGAGLFTLQATIALPAGVALVGAGPHLTVLSGRGLAVAVAPGRDGQIGHLTVSGAKIGVAVDAATGVQLRNLILRDNEDAGLLVGPTGQAQLISATVVRNGSGVRAAGQTSVRNAVVTGNGVGLHALQAGLLISAHDDVYQNRDADYRNVGRGDGDLAVAVTFSATPEDDLRFSAPQPTTDKGDPADDFANEPLPNGGRINIGAFGNTAFAELSAAVPGDEPSMDAGLAPDASTPAEASRGCGCVLGGARDSSDPTGPIAALFLLGWALFRRHRRDG